MIRIRTVCVYCGSSAGSRPEHLAAAEAFGRLLAEAGVGLVYGGGDIGLMGAIARSTLASGGHVTGIIPQFLVDREVMLGDVQELVVTADMHERKRLMFERSDAFVALPGGVGTLEELVEQLTWAQLGRHDKPILIADLAGFWTPLISLLDHMAVEGFLRPGLDVPYLVATRVEDILPALEAAAPLLQELADDADAAAPVGQL
ncbi:TIGR00730 family Rossman fold protein [Hansschlegelia zhihuaiae]|uniref:Cytokinin riboside 5'-monophosphate phosphoribohydrolase n=1 Tax=Hansschlegelia zhihuaiae TaxID=405005 RepID=A0A4Q0MM59_9HYPH|nr:TIGR00730 family Rossman fold protein [Hansschlegelia zhihuaiae]RXF74808.1 TIGR00730 family Rossman fold protein [Hansschlegelia zhihuaiae]